LFVLWKKARKRRILPHALLLFVYLINAHKAGRGFSILSKQKERHVLLLLSAAAAAATPPPPATTTARLFFTDDDDGEERRRRTP
jgi:hypothetical protein